MSLLSLEAELESFGVSCSVAALEKLDAYRARLIRWNRSMNLTALRGADLLRRLIVEPIWVFDRLRPAGEYVDIGSGNGSPAIPWLSMGAFPRADLIESRKKRAVFLRRTCQDLDLSGCQVHACRFSAFVEQKREARIAGAGAPAWITVQGVRPSPELWNKISEIRRQPTRIVWFTATGGAGAESPSESLILPYSGRRALIFGPIHA